jgi:hypothetical protein
MLILIKLQVELSKLLNLLKSKLNFNIGLKFRKLREIEAFFCCKTEFEIKNLSSYAKHLHESVKESEVILYD